MVLWLASVLEKKLILISSETIADPHEEIFAFGVSPKAEYQEHQKKIFISMDHAVG